MKSKLNILFISSWFPTKDKPTWGNFVKAHARSISLLHHVQVIYVAKSKGLQSKYQLVKEYDGDLNISLMYYQEAQTGISFVNKVINTIRHYKAYRKLYKQLPVKPDIVHANVVFPIGILALYLKYRYKLNYVLTEHWSYYKNKQDISFWKRIWFKYIIKNAEFVLPVSESLKQMIYKWNKNLQFKIVSNVVDTSLFNYQEKTKASTFKWIHISTLEPVKNVEGIIRAFAQLLTVQANNHLTIVSDGKLGSIKELILDLKIPEEKLKLIGTSSYKEVSEFLKASDACVQFSIDETFGIVAAESLCCGTPIVSTQVGFLNEFEEGQVGLFVENRNEQDLLEKMKSMQTIKFDHIKCSSEFSEQFNAKKIAEGFSSIYKEVLGR